MENLQLYNSVRVVPPEAQKPITGGRLKNMTDINPMWRIKVLTEQFGKCGEGWKYEVIDKKFVTGGKNEIAVFVDIELRYRIDDKWSEPIPGTGGSMFVENQKNGPYVNDECIKMAVTDAVGVACKALGVGADVYWQKDANKYNEKAPATYDKAVETFDNLDVDNVEITDDDMPKQNPKLDVLNINCEVCNAEMNQAQLTMSKHKFNGRALCPKCQKEA